jgi:hypothetical protein
MSFENPTPLRLGMTGTVADKSYHVVGRVVMGMDDGGVTYYWNEFNLQADDGESATLVFEETERGGEWRLFTMFEPEYPMTAADAATKRIGDSLNLDGTDVRVTLVDESRVYHIEGEAPEGVEVGDVARYFNAEAGDKMQVVSWTGDEVEYYHGIDLPRGAVANAFGLRSESPMGSGSYMRLQGSDSGWLDSAPERYISMSEFVKKTVGVFLGVAILFAGYSFWAPGHRIATVKKVNAPALPLVVGTTGKLDGRNYRVAGHALVEIAQVGLLYDRHEYPLFDDDEHKALLVCGLKPGTKDWFLFTPLQPLTPLTPYQAAAIRAGETVNVDGVVAPVGEVFQSAIRQVESPDLPDLKTGDVFFGFSGQSGSTVLLVRWNNSGISFYQGKAVPAKDVTAAFSPHTRN